MTGPCAMLRVTAPTMAPGLVRPGGDRGCRTAQACTGAAGSKLMQSAPRPMPCRHLSQRQAALRAGFTSQSCRPPVSTAGPACAADSPSEAARWPRSVRPSDAGRFCCITLVALTVACTVLTPAAQAAAAGASGGLSLTGAAQGGQSICIWSESELHAAPCMQTSS